jgi:hypothetical protein
MFLAHFSSTGLDVLLNMPAPELKEWYEEAITLHNKMNKADG